MAGGGFGIGGGTPIKEQQSVSWSAAAWTSDGGGFYHNDQTIAAVDLTKSAVYWRGDGVNEYRDCFLEDATTVRLHTAGSGAPAAETSEAIVVTYGPGVSVQHLSFALTNNTGTGVETADVTVAAIKNTNQWICVENAGLSYCSAASYVSSMAYWITPIFAMTSLTNFRYKAARTGAGNGDTTKHLQLISW
jgi:hypothetical protein